jgi:serine/threonine protein phosphatase PrpC
MQGFRISMEDTHTIRTSLSSQHPDLAFFGIYDGHAGDKASLFLEAKLYESIGALKDPTSPAQLRDCVMKADAEFLKLDDDRHHGSAAVFAMVRSPKSEKKKEWQITVGNLGDSRTILIRADGKFVAMTSDHKPELDGERARILAAGGFVQANRVDGQLAMSRAIGDWPYKDNPKIKPEEQKVVAVPEVTTEIGYEGDSLLLCCDGIFEQMTNEAVVKFVHEAISKHPNDPATVCKLLVIQSLEKGSKDNHSAMLVMFKNGEGYEQKGEFLAGPYEPFMHDTKFAEAYRKDALKHGYQGKELDEMAKKAEADMPEIQEEEGGIAALQAQLNNLPGDPRDKLMAFAQMLGAPLSMGQDGKSMQDILFAGEGGEGDEGDTELDMMSGMKSDPRVVEVTDEEDDENSMKDDKSDKRRKSPSLGKGKRLGKDKESDGKGSDKKPASKPKTKAKGKTGKQDDKDSAMDTSSANKSAPGSEKKKTASGTSPMNIDSGNSKPTANGNAVSAANNPKSPTDAAAKKKEKAKKKKAKAKKEEGCCKGLNTELNRSSFILIHVPIGCLVMVPFVSCVM